MATPIENLYNASANEYEVGTFDDFKKSMSNVDSRKNLYDALTNDGFELGEWDDFNNIMTNELKQDIPSFVDNVSKKDKELREKMNGNPYLAMMQEAADNYTPIEDDSPSWWDTLKNGFKSGILGFTKNLASFNEQTAGLKGGNNDPYTGYVMPISKKERDENIKNIQQHGEKMMTPYTERVAAAERVKTGEGDERDERISGGVRMVEKIGKKQEEYSAKAKPNKGETDFIEMFKEGEWGDALQLGLATALESAPQMLLAALPGGAVALGATSAAGEYDRLARENSDMPEWKRVSSAIGYGLIEQYLEKKGVNPLKWGAKGAGKEITRDIAKELEDFAAKSIKQKLKNGLKKAGKVGLDLLKDTAEEGLEEVATDIGQDLWNSGLDLLDMGLNDGILREGEGFANQYIQAQKENQKLTIDEFAKQKAKQYLNDFIGGAAAGAYMGGTSYGIGAIGRYAGTSKTEKEAEKAYYTDLNKAFDYVSEETGIDRKVLEVEMNQALNYDLKNSEIVQQIDHAVAQIQIERDAKSRIQAYKNKDGNLYPVVSESGTHGYIVDGDVEVTTTADGTQMLRGDGNVTIRFDNGLRMTAPLSKFKLAGDVSSEADVVNNIVAQMMDMSYGNRSKDTDVNVQEDVDAGVESVDTEPSVEEIDNNVPSESGVEAEQVQETPTPSYPVKEDGSPDYDNMSAEQQVAYATETGGQEKAAALITGVIEDLQDEKDKIAKNKHISRLERMDKMAAIDEQINQWQALMPQEESAVKDTTSIQPQEETTVEPTNETESQAEENVDQEQSAIQQENGVDEITVEPTSSANARSLSSEESDALVEQMEQNAELAPQIELTPENWVSQFGEDGMVETPIGRVKMGENQLGKLILKKRQDYFGMIYPTLSNPDVIIEKNSPEDNAERNSKYIFIKTFIKPDGSRIVHFESITVQKGGMEVSISSHEAESKDIKKDMQNGNILHISDRLPLGSELSLTKAPNTERPDIVPTSDSSSANKGTTNSSSEQMDGENNVKVDLTSDDIVLMYDGNGRYKFCRRLDDGRYIAIDTGKPLQMTRSGKETAWKEAKKRIVYMEVDGEMKPFYLLSDQSEDKLRTYTGRTGQYINVRPTDGGAVQSVDIKNLMWQQEDGSYSSVYVPSQQRQQNDLKEKVKNATSIDEALDYPLFMGHTKDGKPIRITVRSLIESGYKNTLNGNQVERVWKGKDLLKSVVEKIVVQLNNDSTAMDVRSGLRQRINEAIQIWNAVIERNGYDESAKTSSVRAFNILPNRFKNQFGNPSMKLEPLKSLDKLDNSRTNPLDKIKDCMDGISRFHKVTGTQPQANTPTDEKKVTKNLENGEKSIIFAEKGEQENDNRTRSIPTGQNQSGATPMAGGVQGNSVQRVSEGLSEGTGQRSGRDDAKDDTSSERQGDTTTDGGLDNDVTSIVASIYDAYEKRGIPHPTQKLQRATPQAFHDAIVAAKTANEHGWSVDVHDVEDYQNDTLLLSEDGKAGVAITPDGEIISVFSASKEKGMMKILIPTAVMLGGKKGDCYVTGGIKSNLADMYGRFGLRVSHKIAFAEEYMGEDFAAWKAEHPDEVPRYVAFLYFDGNANTVMENYNDHYEANMDAVPLIEDSAETDAYTLAGQERDALLDSLGQDNTTSAKDVPVVDPEQLRTEIASLEEQIMDAIDEGDEATIRRLQEERSAKQKQYRDLQFQISEQRRAVSRRAAGERVVDSLQKAGILVETISEADAGSYIGEAKMQQLHDTGGVLYGFTDGKKIVLIAERMNPNTPIHEYTHLWVEAYRQEHPKAWKEALELLKQTDEWLLVLNDPNYKDIAGDEQKVASEVLSRLTADYFSGEAGKGYTRFDLLANNGLRVRIASFLSKFWKTITGWFGKKTSTPTQIQALINRPMEDLLRERKESEFDKKYKKIEESLDKGGRDVLSLQEITELTNALENDIRQGNKPLVFERIPFEALEGLQGEQRTLAETLAIVARRSRRQSRALERNGREVTSEEILSRDGSNTDMLLDLMAYAKEKGIWMENVVETLDERYGMENRLRPGAESEVWADKERGVVIKAKVSDYYETVEEFLEGMLLNNWLFDGNSQKIIGIGIDRRAGRDGIRFVYETPYVESQSSTPLSQEEKDSFMANFGFKKVAGENVHPEKNGESSRYTNGVFDIGDLHNMNIVRDENGIIRCTDPIIRWVRGEHYRARTEAEIEQDAVNEERLDNEFDEKEYSIESIIKSFNRFLDGYKNKSLDRRSAWHASLKNKLLPYIPNSNVLRISQSVLTKAENKHNVDIDSLYNLPELLVHPIAVFRSARKDVNAKVVLIEAKDKDGNNIVVAINVEGGKNGIDVNDVTSIYGRENFGDFARWEEQGLLETGDYEKFKAWFASLPEYNSRGERKTMLEKVGAKLQQISESTKSEANKFEYQIQSTNPTSIDEEIKAKRQQLIEEADSVESLNKKDGTAYRMNKMAKAITIACDNTHPLLLLQEKVNQWREEHGKEPSPEKHDIRSLINRASSKSVSRINWFEQHEQKKLVGLRNRMEDAISKSELMDMFHEDIVRDDNVKEPHHLNSARDLLERYLIAKDNVEREQFGIPSRGRQEFEDRMGVTFEEYIELFESKIDTNLIALFHSAVRGCTNVSIQALFDAGMIDEEQFESFGQRQWYVPEKDFFEKEISDDKPDKKEKRKGGKNTLRASALQKAEGGETLATNVLEYVIHDVQNSICLAEENMCRQAMMDFVSDNLDYWQNYGLQFPTPVWYIKTGESTNGEPIYERTTERPSDDLFEEVAILRAKIQECKEALKSETDPDTIRQIRDDIKYYQNQMPIVSAKRAGEYNPKLTATSREQVVVYRNGIRYEMNFAEMQGVADALNGVYDLDGIESWTKRFSAFVASIFTTYNPTFFAVNIVRDVPFVAAKGYSQYGFGFEVRFTQYLSHVSPDGIDTRKAIVEYLNGELDPSKGEAQQALYNFLQGGGNTGWTQTQDIQSIKRRMDKNGFFDKPVVGKAAKMAEHLNEYSELLTRFAAYRAVLRIGESEHEALKAAKNLSTNFNMRGYGTKFLNYFNSISMFANAAIQGALAFWRSFDSKKHIARGVAAMVFMPALLGFLNTLLVPDIDPDDEDERDSRHISDYYRENYFIIGNWVKIPITPEFRPFWNIGVNAALMMMNRRSVGKATNSIIKSFVTNLLPVPPAISDAIASGSDLAFTGSGDFLSPISHLFLPEYSNNIANVKYGKDFMGNDFKKYDFGTIPQYKLAENEEKLYKDIAYGFYLMSGGSKDAPSKFKKDSFEEEVWNWNPREVHAALSTVFGDGWLKTISSTYALVFGTVESIFDDSQSTKDMFKYTKVDKLPLVSSFYKPEKEEKVEYETYRRMKDIIKNYESYQKEIERLAKAEAIKGNEKELQALTAEYKRKIKEQAERGFNPALWNVLVEGYRNNSVYNLANKLNLSQDELKKLYPNLKDTDNIETIARYMNEELMKYDGIEEHIDWIQEIQNK